MSSNSYSQQDRQRFKLLHGGLTEEALDADWQQFCEHIGWQQLSEPALPDDYEEQMMARIFGAQGHDNVVELPSGARPSGVRPAGGSLDTGSLGTGSFGASPSTVEYRPEPLAALALQEVGELPAPLGAPDGLTRSRRLPWLAAAAALLLGVVGASVLSHSDDSTDPILAAPAPVPERAAPEQNRAERVAPIGPERVEDSPQRDKPIKRPRVPTRKMVIVPPGGSQTPPHSEPPRAPRPDAVRVASVDGEHAAMAPAGEHRYVGAEYGYARPSAHVGAPTAPAAFEAPMPKLSPTVALSSAWPERASAKAMPAAVSSARVASAGAGVPPHGDADGHTPWQASSSWYGLGMTAPREDSGVPAGVRVTAQLDAIEAGRRLFGRL